MKLYEELKSRGFVKQMTAEENIIKAQLNDKKLSIYIGFDPTKESLHVGHLMPIMLLSHIQKHGHRPICIVGGATALIGDPSGKDSMREMLTAEKIDDNLLGIKKQLSHFINFDDGKALILNNYDWTGKQNYIEFIRDIGAHFTVNRMLAAECFKMRMEKGLTFLEFNYMLLQAYDFYVLSKEYDCTMELGGDDQWSNIIAGIELVRRKDQKEVFGMTFPLLTKSDGKKMGKTEGGAIWLDKNLTSPFEYFQFWRNSADADVIKLLKIFTYISLDEIKQYEKLEGAELNEAKELLAYEATRVLHGKEEADKAKDAAKKLFSGGNADESSMPTYEITKDEFLEMSVVDIFIKGELFATKGEAKRMIKQGGVSINKQKINDFMQKMEEKDIKENKIMLQKGKKKFVLIKII